MLGPYPYLIGVIRGLTSGDPHLVPLIVFQAGVLIGMGAVSKALSWLLLRARGNHDCAQNIPRRKDLKRYNDWRR